MRLKEQVDAYKNKKKVAKRLKEDLAVKPAQLSGIRVYRIYVYICKVTLVCMCVCTLLSSCYFLAFAEVANAVIKSANVLAEPAP